MSLQEDAKKLKPLIDAAAEGKGLRTKDDDIDLESISGIMKGSHFFGINALKIIEPPHWRPWKSTEEMGEAVNDWFRHKTTGRMSRIKLIVLQEIGFNDDNYLASLKQILEEREHTPTPWLADSWKPCGVEEKESGR